MLKGLVTVGVPVCNEGKYIRETLDSLIANYDYVDRIIISDNCSDDDSGSICSEFADKYEKIEYVKLSERVSMSDNWMTSLNMAHSKYFMWLAGHDVISEHYFQILIQKLEENPQAMLTMPMVYFFKENIANRWVAYDGYHSLLSSVDIEKRIMGVIEDWGVFSAGNQIYRLDFLKDILKKPLLNEQAGTDQLMAFYAAVAGPCVTTDKVAYYYRVVRDPETPEQTAKRYAKAGIPYKKINPLRYFPTEFWRLCKTYIPQESDIRLKNQIMQLCHMNRDADMKDEDWILRHESGAMIKKLRNSQKKIVIFGTGGDAAKLCNVLGYSLNITCFVDNNPSVQGMEFWGRPIISAMDLLELKGDVFILVSSSKYYHEIFDQLEALGFSYWEEYLYWKEGITW